MKPNFRNIPNECVRTEDGREVWLSRSCAVAAHVVAVDKQFGSPHILAVQRGHSCPDFIEWFCLPCGYIDRNETSNEAARRETWEETGVDLFSLGMEDGVSVLYSDIVDHETQNPWHVNTSPDANRQNITLHHGVLISVNKLPAVTNVNNEKPGEIKRIEWIPLQDFIGYRYSQDYVSQRSVPCEGQYPVCFNHEKRAWGFVKEIVYPTLLKRVRSLQDMGQPVRLPDWMISLDDKTKNSLDPVVFVEAE